VSLVNDLKKEWNNQWEKGTLPFWEEGFFVGKDSFSPLGMEGYNYEGYPEENYEGKTSNLFGKGGPSFMERRST